MVLSTEFSFVKDVLNFIKFSTKIVSFILHFIEILLVFFSELGFLFKFFLVLFVVFSHLFHFLCIISLFNKWLDLEDELHPFPILQVIEGSEIGLNDGRSIALLSLLEESLTGEIVSHSSLEHGQNG